MSLAKWASGHEFLGASCPPGTPSRQAKRSSPLATRGNRAKSKLNSLSISLPYHHSKGASDLASSHSARSGSSEPHRLDRDTQASPRLRILLITRTRKVMQKPPPGPFLIRWDFPGYQQAPTHHCHYHRLPSASLLLCLVCPALVVYLVLGILSRASRFDLLRAPVQSSCALTLVEPTTEATVAAERGDSVAREIQDGAPMKNSC